MSIGPTGGVSMMFVNERDAPTADLQPRVEVSSWRLLRAPEGTLHLVLFAGRAEQSATVRVTSPITAVDQGAGIVTTSSGRQYVLIAPFEERELERDMLRNGAVTLGLRSAVDVSMLAWDQVEIG